MKSYAIAKGRESGSSRTGLYMETEEWNRWIAMLRAYGKSINRNELLKINRQTVKPVMIQAQREVARIERTSKWGKTTGNLWESIGLITGRSREFVNVQVGPRAKRKFKGWHGHLVEFGTEWRKTKKGYGRGSAKARPFMKPAFDKTFGSVKKDFENNVAGYIQKQADKSFK